MKRNLSAPRERLLGHDYALVAAVAKTAPAGGHFVAVAVDGHMAALYDDERVAELSLTGGGLKSHLKKAVLVAYHLVGAADAAVGTRALGARVRAEAAAAAAAAGAVAP